jgi:hypothetical protein
MADAGPVEGGKSGEIKAKPSVRLTVMGHTAFGELATGHGS